MIRCLSPLLRGVVLVVGLCGAAAADEAPPVASVGDAALGEKVFVKCRACHQIGATARNSVGPELNGLIGRHSGSVPGYTYSEANKNSGLTWDEATFRRYIANPQSIVPGTKMTFAGLTREKDIDNVLAYLQRFNPDGSQK